VQKWSNSSGKLWRKKIHKGNAVECIPRILPQNLAEANKNEPAMKIEIRMRQRDVSKLSKDILWFKNLYGLTNSLPSVLNYSKCLSQF